MAAEVRGHYEPPMPPFPFFRIAAQHVWKTQSAEIHAHEKESGQTDRSLGGINLSAGFLTVPCRVQFLGQIFAATADLLTILSRVQVFRCHAVVFSCKSVCACFRKQRAYCIHHVRKRNTLRVWELLSVLFPKRQKLRAFRKLLQYPGYVCNLLCCSSVRRCLLQSSPEQSLVAVLCSCKNEHIVEVSGPRIENTAPKNGFCLFRKNCLNVVRPEFVGLLLVKNRGEPALHCVRCYYITSRYCRKMPATCSCFA